MLDVDGLRKTYSGRGREVEAVRDLTFRLGEGELACLVGPSGCGKTTLLKCVSGLMRPTAGSVALDGRPVTGPPPDMAVVFQEYGRSLFPWLTVRGNVELPLKEKRLPKPRRRELVDGALEAVGLGHAGSQHPWELSGGMQQRVAIARAIAYEPRVLLMDEPFAAVDAQTRADLEDLIRGLWQRFSMTVLFVTHDIDEAVYLGQRVIVLSASPTVVQDDVSVDLPDERDQLTTRSAPRFAELRAHVYREIQNAKNGGGGPSGTGATGTGGAEGSGADGGGGAGDAEGADGEGGADGPDRAPTATGGRR
ncbi:ABC transporter ATP-binding protein [Nocardiopsis sp. RSe5-2]|uniref:ABC transporter ATP-binding protein n=1 Tax=Nocardiopsis endophytica TaxID=3018445 RepID=A0ABT4UAF6_9ACTN|nr:ABC transporter ATP-binding protein [Nocardiopsis endophytica]MDA2813380.1 ABC transporter ATP-binding protein [Nocardiopsis endophytica]